MVVAAQRRMTPISSMPDPESTAAQKDATQTLNRLTWALLEEYRKFLARWLHEVAGAPDAVR